MVSACKGKWLIFVPLASFRRSLHGIKLTVIVYLERLLRRANLQPAPRAICRHPSSIPALSRSGEHAVTISSFFACKGHALAVTRPHAMSSSLCPHGLLHILALFSRPLFSYSYELLFPQALCFDNHPHCPRVSPSTDPTFRHSAVQILRNPFPCHTYEKCVRNPSICHTSKIAALQVLCLPHIRKRRGVSPCFR
jgi:hypothetical protein